jgi:hypothetical protein
MAVVTAVARVMAAPLMTVQVAAAVILVALLPWSVVPHLQAVACLAVVCLVEVVRLILMMTYPSDWLHTRSKEQDSL